MEKDLENEYSVDKENIWKRFYLYRDKLEGIHDSGLDNETLGILFRAIIEYIINYGEEPEINNITVKAMFKLIVADINRDKREYIKVCKQNHENALKGKKANANDGKRTQTNANDGERTIADKDKDKDNDNDKDKDKDKDKEKKEKNSLSLLKESDREKNKNLFFELEEPAQLFYLENWLRDYFVYDSGKVQEEAHKRLFYIKGNVKDKTKTIEDIKNYVCSYWANIAKLEYQESEMTLEKWEKMMETYDENHEIVSSAYDSIKCQIEKGERINDNDVKTVKNLRVYLDSEQWEYLKEHGIID